MEFVSTVQNCSRRIMLMLALALLSTLNFQSTSEAQLSQLPELEIIRTKTELQKHLNDLSERHFLLANLKDKRSPVVQLDLEFDRRKFQSDFEKHQQTQKQLEQQATNAKWQESSSRFLEFLKAAQQMQSTGSSTEQQAQQAANAAPGPRFGILNTGALAPPKASGPASAAKPQPIVPSLNFSSPNVNFQPTPFSYSLLDYVVNVSVEVHVPVEFKEEKRTELRKAIVSFLNLPALTSANADQKVKMVEMVALEANKSPTEAEKAAKADEANWLKDLLNPKNQSLSGLFMSLAALLGLILVGAAVFLTGRTLSKSLGAIAQANQANAQERASSEESFEPESAQSSAALPETKVSGGSKSKFSADKEADLLSQTRTQISENLAQWCANDPVTVGEVLVDLASGQNGMSSLNSLLLYSGYKNLKPALELLPNKLLRKLDESLSDSWKEGAELLPGLEAAQLLLAGMIPRQTSLLRFSYDTVPVRRALLKQEIGALGGLCNELTLDEACTIFRILPQGVALAVSEQLSPTRLKEIMDALGQSENNQKPTDSLIEKIQALGRNSGESKSIDKERLIRGMLRGQRSANENKILDYFGPEDLVLRFELLKERFFARDLALVEAPLLRSVIEKLPLQRRANFLYFLEAPQRQSILELYPKESKQLEALLEELENIDKSAKRKTAANNDKTETSAFVSDKILEKLKSDTALRISILEKIAASMQSQIPPEIRTLAEQVRGDAA